MWEDEGYLNRKFVIITVVGYNTARALCIPLCGRILLKHNEIDCYFLFSHDVQTQRWEKHW
jgi:hypothetical protein